VPGLKAFCSLSDYFPKYSNVVHKKLYSYFWDTTLEEVSKPHIGFKGKARADEKAQHTW
jgi:hypothetical protein